MRLIDADALIEKIRSIWRMESEPEHKSVTWKCAMADAVILVLSVIAKMLPIDAEPVRHGRWVKDKERNTYCSVCDCYIPAVHCRQDYQDDFSEWDEEIDETDYCPHCGAKMDAKEA